MFHYVRDVFLNKTFRNASLLVLFGGQEEGSLINMLRQSFPLAMVRTVLNFCLRWSENEGALTLAQLLRTVPNTTNLLPSAWPGLSTVTCCTTAITS